MGEQIPYVAYESSLTRADQTNKRLWILCLVLAVMLVLTNLGWVIRESQYAVTESTVIQVIIRLKLKSSVIMETQNFLLRSGTNRSKMYCALLMS